MVPADNGLQVPCSKLFFTLSTTNCPISFNATSGSLALYITSLNSALTLTLIASAADNLDVALLKNGLAGIVIVPYSLYIAYSLAGIVPFGGTSSLMYIRIFLLHKYAILWSNLANGPLFWFRLIILYTLPINQIILLLLLIHFSMYKQ